MCVAFRIGFYGVFADSRLFAHASLDLHLSFSSVRGWGGMGGVMTSMRMRLVSSVSFVALLLKRCRLLCEALVAASYCFTFETSTMQKPRVFAAFQTKTSKTTQKNQLNKKQEKSMVCDTFAKALPQNKDKKHGKTKTPTHRVVDENLANYRVCLTSTKKTSQQ